jgi:FkbM family methyltransferase
VLSRPFFGYRLHVDVSRTSTQGLLYLEGERLIVERDLLGMLARPGNRVVDVGANIGYYVLLFRRLIGPDAAIDAFEPDPDNRVELERNVRANALPNVRLHAAAVGARAGTVALAPGLNSKVEASGTVQVPMVTLDAAVSGRVDLLKIDVDGYEGFVLEGAQGLLERERPALFLELHPQLVPPEHDVARLVEGLRALYPEVELWQPARSSGLLPKLAERYLPGHAVHRFADPDRLLAACSAGEHRETFWAVCPRPPGRG